MKDYAYMSAVNDLVSKVDYDPITGEMRWRHRHDGSQRSKIFNSKFAGKECGSITGYGYKQICFQHEHGKKIKVLVHRLAWFLVNGVFPTGETDHLNGNKLDNRMSNLRDVHVSVNQKNRKMAHNNTSGITGVYWNKRYEKWYAYAGINGKLRYVGRSGSKDEAAQMIKNFHSENGFTERHGK